MGTVAAKSRLTVLMFTDIVDSTALKSELGAERYLEKLLRHDELFKRIVGGYAGAEVVSDTGDGFFARFSAVSDAVNAALRFQHALSRPDAPTQPLRVRVGMHVGNVTEFGLKDRKEAKIVGVAADLAARVMSLATGGQILMTGPTYKAAHVFVQEHPEAEAGVGERPALKWAEHGAYKFKGLTWPVEIYEVGAEGVGIFTAPEDSPKARRWTEGDEVEYWQSPVVQNVVPVLASVMFHAAIIVAAMATMQAIRVVAPAAREQAIVPDSPIVSDGPGDGGGLLNPGLGNDPTRRAAQDRLPDVPRDAAGIARHLGMTLLPEELGGGGDSAGPQLIGTGASGLGGSGPGIGSGGRDSGELAPFGVSGGQGIGLRCNFIGLGGSGSRVVFVCDATGSMGQAFEGLKKHLRTTVGGMTPNQSFNIILFQAKSALAMENRALVPATAANKQRAYQYLESCELRYGSNPIPALEKAFEQKPQLIYLLSDGDFFDAEDAAGNQGGNALVVDYCRKKTADGKTRINTIAFVRRSGPLGTTVNPEAMEFVQALRRIAADSKGQFKAVTEEEMGGGR